MIMIKKKIYYNFCTCIVPNKDYSVNKTTCDLYIKLQFVKKKLHLSYVRTI